MFGRKGRILLGAGGALLTGAQVEGTASVGVLLTELAVLGLADHLDCWSLRDTNRVRPIADVWLQQIEDRKGIYVGTPEAEAYAQIIVQANYTSHAAFRKTAERTISYGMLFNHPEEHRGKVICVEGRLKRIERVVPMFEAAVEGVHDLYVGYIFNDLYEPHPYRVIFTEWPAGLPRDLLAAKVNQKIEVSFAGYFFKRYRYKAGDSKANTSRDAPMLVGHSLTVGSIRNNPVGAGEQTDPFGSWTTYIVYSILSSMLGLVALVVGMAWWFRRTDQKLRRILAAVAGEFVLPPAEEPIRKPLTIPLRSRRGHFPVRKKVGLGSGQRGRVPLVSEAGGKPEKDPGDPEEGAGP